MCLPRLLCVVLLLSGCSTVRRWAGISLPTTPKAIITTPSGVGVQQTGDAAVPAKVTTTKVDTAIDVPPGTKITLETPSVAGTPLAKLVSTSTTEAVTAPQAFTPPAPPEPPSPTDLAKASGIRWLYGGAALLILGGMVVALVLKHPLNGGIMIAGGVVVAMIANFLSEVDAIVAIAVVLSLSAGITIAWLRLRKYHPEYIAALQKKAKTVSSNGQIQS